MIGKSISHYPILEELSMGGGCFQIEARALPVYKFADSLELKSELPGLRRAMSLKKSYDAWKFAYRPM